ncbi:hypothetical protein MYMA111404_04450 [Mycoplasma marinum]|uniref:hypothetical protein n=1 Tax=Mycoplasma marinum TaxID=1937190 RepID=UPI003B374FF4
MIQQQKKAQVSVNFHMHDQPNVNNSSIIQNVTFQAINDMHSKSILHFNNLDKLKDIINKTKTKELSNFEKASEIAARITDVASLKKELGIDLSSIKGSTFVVKAKGKTSGEIDLEISLNTIDGSSTKTDIVKKA